MTEAQARHRLREAQNKRIRFKGSRNFWRKIVVKRRRYLKELILRRRKRQKPHVSGPNKIRGAHGTQRQKEALILYTMRVARKEFRLHYLDGGTAPHRQFALTNVPHDWERSDCSLWAGDVPLVCGLGDLIFKGDSIRFTGTALKYGVECSEEYAMHHTGCGVIFGEGDGFHMGLSVGNGTKAIYQHGTAPVSKGTFDEFGSGVEVRYRRYF